MYLIEKLQKINREELLTGQLFFRFMGPTVELDLTNRQMFAVIGSLAVPKDLIKDEHQYTLAGFKRNVTGELIVGVDLINPINLTERFRGFNLDQILLEPIWKI
jgi:hypothetical protein